ncbi:sterile alpha motif domain-containing protein 12-like isoform X2 [Narcine bancroftii]|uniref:sterile alpha motif domain-containing protein 12-like isoform X2 n=1 Tax=Narcine bancroftii TaxID=1343680 RepID=UPI0038311196
MSQNNPPQSCQIKTKELCDHQLQIVPLNYSGVQLELEECKIRVVKNEEMRNKRVSLWTVDEVCEWIKSHNPSHNSGFVAAIYGHAISGRALLRLTAEKLEQMGIDQESHRYSLFQDILRLRIQDDVESLTTIFAAFSTMGSARLNRAYAVLLYYLKNMNT